MTRKLAGINAVRPLVIFLGVFAPAMIFVTMAQTAEPVTGQSMLQQIVEGALHYGGPVRNSGLSQGQVARCG